MGESSNDPITCEVGRWYYKRMLLMALMLGVFGAWFLYDGAVGWPRKNRGAVAEELFNAAKAGASWEQVTEQSKAFKEMVTVADEPAMELFREAHTAGQSKMPWKDYARKNRLSETPDASPKEVALREAFEAGGEPGAAWVDYALRKSLVPEPKDDDTVAVRRAYEAAGQGRDWAGFAFEHGWESKDNKYHTLKEVHQQFVIGGACGLGAAIAVFLLLLNRNRTLSADGESFTNDKGVRVPFSSVFRIDKRKWDDKGLAYVYFCESPDESGSERKVVIDDLKYVGAASVLERLSKNFKGKLLVRDGGDEPSGTEPEAQAAGTASETREAPEKS